MAQLAAEGRGFDPRSTQIFLLRNTTHFEIDYVFHSMEFAVKLRIYLIKIRIDGNLETIRKHGKKLIKM